MCSSHNMRMTLAIDMTCSQVLTKEVWTAGGAGSWEKTRGKVLGCWRGRIPAGSRGVSPDANVLLISSVYVPNQTSGVPAITLCLVQITWEDLKAAEAAVGDFGSDNRAGVQGTLHRISAMRSRKGTVVGLTCRVGRAVTGHVDMIRDILDGKTFSNSLWSFGIL